MQSAELVKKFKSTAQDFFRNSLHLPFAFLIVSIMICFSHLQKYFRLSLFNDEIRKAYFTNMSETIPTTLPSKDLLSTIFRHLLGCIFTLETAKGFNQPSDENFVSRRNRNVDLIMFIPIFPVSTVISNAQTSFSVQYSCHVGSGRFRVFLTNINTSSRHGDSIFNVSTFVNYNKKMINLQPERLSPMASEEDAIVRTTNIYKIVESGRNDQIARKSGNSLEQVILQDQEGSALAA